jgi:RimJ/RimL family protein N-acetyltransferase
MAVDVKLRAWAPDDLWLMERLLGDPRMTEHLGGPESPERLQERLDDYQRTEEPESGRMSVIIVGTARDAAGSIGYWALDWRGETVWEAGWHVLPEFQGRGIATAAVGLVVAQATADGRHRWMHAFPAVDNEPSNAVCRRSGFTNLGPCDFEYPAGHQMRCNDWAIALHPEGRGLGGDLVR